MKTVATMVACLAGVAGAAFAGAVIEIDDQSKIDVGFRVQPLLIVTQSDLDGDGTLDTETDFKVRRGRLRLKGTLTDRVTAFLQTDMTGANGGGYDWRVIDAWVSIKLAPSSLRPLEFLPHCLGPPRRAAECRAP